MKPIVLNAIGVEDVVRACDTANEKDADIIIRVVDGRSTRDIYQMLGCYDYITKIKGSMSTQIYFEATGMLHQHEALVMLAVDPDKRRVSERSMLIWDQPRSIMYGTAEEAQIAIEARLELINSYAKIFSEHTDLSVDEIKDLMEKGEFFDRDKMAFHGFLDKE